MRWLAFSAALAACSSPSPPCDMRFPRLVWPLGLPGDALQITVPHVARCGLRTVTAEASVVDPNGDTVPSTVDQVASQSDNRIVSARVTFTPRVPGPHHTVVRFEPSLGLEQNDVDVAVDRRLGPAVLELDGGEWASCQHVDVLPSGRPICLPRPCARAGATLWLSDGGELSRWVERDGGLVRDPDEALQLSHVLLLPGEDDVFALSGVASESRVSVVSDGGLRVTAQFGRDVRTSWAAWRGDDAGYSIITGVAIDVVLGAGPTGIARWRPVMGLLEWFDPVTEMGINHAPYDDALKPYVRAPMSEWDTGALLVALDGGTSFAIDRNFGFTAFGRVTSLTSAWATVERDGKLLLLKR